MWTGRGFHPIPRLIVGVIALIVGLIIHQPVMDIAGVVLLVFAGVQLAGRGGVRR
jgi:hypothetical protein